MVDDPGPCMGLILSLLETSGDAGLVLNSQDVGIFVGLLVLSGIFSGSESALTALNPVKLKTHVNNGDRTAIMLDRLLSDPSRLISALLIGNNIVNVALTTFAAIVFGDAFESLLDGNEAMAATLAAVVSIVFLLVVGEVIPKTIGVNMPMRFARVVCWPMTGVMMMLTPLTIVLAGLQKLVLKTLGHKDDGGGIKVTSDDLKTMVEIAQSQEVLKDHSGDVIARLVSLHETTVREVMTPRIEVCGVEVNTSWRDLVRSFTTHRFSRMPAYEGHIDQIIGVVNIRDVLSVALDDVEQFNVRHIVRPALFVPETKEVDTLIQQMREEKTHLAVVVDEFGGTAGVVSLEDLLEEFVGQIEDEYDAESRPFRKVSSNAWLVDGSCTLSEFSEEVEIDFGVIEEVDTLAGLFVREFGKLPTEGDVISFKGLELHVRKRKAQRITRLLVRRDVSRRMLNIADEALLQQESVRP